MKLFEWFDSNSSSQISPPEKRVHGDCAWLVALLVVSAFLRFSSLDATPFHHDESIHAWFSYRLWTGHSYTYDPVYHGPFLYWTTALMYQIFGDSDFIARLLPAFFSCCLVLLCWALRSALGRIGWFVAALFMVVSPTFTYYGRFLGHDNYVAFFTLAIVFLFGVFVKGEKRLPLCLLGIILGCFIATKACFYLHIGIFVGFFFFTLLLNTFAPEMPRARMLQHWAAMVRRNTMNILWAVSLFLLSYILLYSSFFSNWKGVVDGVVQTLSYWGGQQVQPRIPGPFYYYMPRLIIHEPVFYLVLPAIIWAGARALRPFDLFLAYWTLAAFIVYSFAQEKVPWLLMHILLPMSLLSGRFVQVVIQKKGVFPWMFIFLMFLFSWSLRENLWLSFRSPPDQPHLLKYMATDGDIHNVVTRLSAQKSSPHQRIVSGKATWPLAWYLREDDITYSLTPSWQESADIVIVDAEEALVSENFTAETYTLNNWWQPDYGQLLSSALYPYVVKRTITGLTGSTSFQMLTRHE
ncbi:MAG: flippase activity-associated protein Agl23 [Desulfopila sp.]|jgi:uncharacterized protein (TIGR03663 family)|nr:flippase activity-associated protein Agl23 [Desulfopila sp.]